jgi:hypothetical protein
MGAARNGIPVPAPMPVDREQWARQISLANFVNAYYQYRDIRQCDASCKSILMIGPGQGLDALILRWKGYEITTFDIDETFDPDVVGSAHDLSMFGDQSFDVVIASHVLEHLAEPYLNDCLGEIARVGRWAVVYLPVHGRHLQVRFIPGFKGIDMSFVFDLFNYFEKPDGLTPQYMEGQHYWEVGMRGFRVRELRRRFEGYFEIVDCYRNKDWLPSHNFVLRSRDP